MTTVDLTPLLQGGVNLAGAILYASAPVIAIYLIRLFHLQQASILGKAISNAVQAGAGVAYEALVAAAAQRHVTVEVKQQAIAAGAQHVIDTVPQALAKTGATDTLIAQRVAGELGRLLATDPTVSAGAAAIVPPPGPAGA